MSNVIIYHNSRCSKSRKTFEILQENKIDFDEVRYLETPPSVQELQSILSKLNYTPRQLLRTGQQEYKDQNLADNALSDEKIIQAMVDFPILIERPIVINGDKAVIGRPPENVLAII